MIGLSSHINDKANRWNKATRKKRRGPLQPAHILPTENSLTGQSLAKYYAGFIVNSSTITIITITFTIFNCVLVFFNFHTITIITITITIFNCVLVFFNFHQLHCCSGKKAALTITTPDDPPPDYQEV